MLPEHVGIILLSATVPNTYEFADWIGYVFCYFHNVGFISHRVPSLPYFCAEDEEIFIEIFMFKIIRFVTMNKLNTFKRAKIVRMNEIILMF